jgi:NTP pyrophosphatase (non-canonical NTP hydrolase)
LDKWPLTILLRQLVFLKKKERKMELKDLTEKMHTFVRSKGWYEPDSKRPQTPRNLAISLSLEANEVLEHYQWQGELNDDDELASELADVALYLMQLASVSGVDLEEAILKKLEINSSRTWDAKP